MECWLEEPRERKVCQETREEEKVDAVLEAVMESCEVAAVREWLRAFFRMHVQSHNVAHYTGDYSTKFADSLGRLLPALACGVTNLEQCVRSNFAPATGASVDAAGDSYVHKRLSFKSKPKTWKETTERGRLLLIKLQTSANRTIVKKLTEMHFQLLHGHECYPSHNTWTLYTKRPVSMAWKVLERRRRKRRGEDYYNLDDYLPPSGRGGDDEGADDGNAQNGGVEEQGMLRSFVDNAEEGGQ